MGLFDRFKKTAEDVKDKAGELADSHGDQAKDAIDKAADVIDDKTGNKHSDKIDQGADAAKDAIDKLAGDDAFRKGEACLGDECIRFVASTPREVTAVIRDGHMYNTIVRTVDDRLGWSCSCGDVSREAPCRHVVALALALKKDPKLGE